MTKVERLLREAKEQIDMGSYAYPEWADEITGELLAEADRLAKGPVDPFIGRGTEQWQVGFRDGWLAALGGEDGD